MEFSCLFATIVEASPSPALIQRAVPTMTINDQITPDFTDVLQQSQAQSKDVTMDVLLLKPGETTAKMVDLRRTQPMLEILGCLELQGYVLLKEATEVPESWDWAVPNLSDNKVERPAILRKSETVKLTRSAVCQNDRQRLPRGRLPDLALQLSLHEARARNGRAEGKDHGETTPDGL